MRPDSVGTLYQLHNAIALAQDEENDKDVDNAEDERSQRQIQLENRQHLQWLHLQASR
jgi:hypothetical protein